MKERPYGMLMIIAIIINTSAYANCRTDITSSTPDDRFDILDNGTVTDKQTGLNWMRCSIGQTWNGSNCAGFSERFTFTSALNRAEFNNYANHTDWRLPNIKELASIVEESCSSPVINETIFPNTSLRIFWSSSVASRAGGIAMYLDFNDGDIRDTSWWTEHNIRLVRTVN